MAHIQKNKRPAIELAPIGASGIKSSSELGYAFYLLAQQLFTKYPAKGNSILGAFERAKQEFYRKSIAPAERQSEFDNGEIY